MKKVILFMAIASLFGCKKKTTTPSNPTTPQTVYHDLPYWINDTLTCPNSKTFVIDTVIAIANSNGTFVKYKGVQYQLKAYELQYTKWSDSDGVYYCDMFDPSNKQVNPDSSLNVQVSVSKSWNKTYQKWDTNHQAFYPQIALFPQGTGVFVGK